MDWSGEVEEDYPDNWGDELKILQKKWKMMNIIYLYRI